VTTVALVTGAGGFLGGAIARRLLARGWLVRSLARGRYPALEAAGVDCRRGDLADGDAVASAVDGCDIVFHVAAKAGAWGPESEYHDANVVGTQNVLDACRRHGVPRLVHTSSPSVVHAGSDIEGGDESLPYADEFDAPYPRTKAIAEQAVLASNDEHLATVALRPHLIWGPGDTQLVPRIVARARAGRLRLVGDGSNLVDSVYIDNAADAHLLAADRLAPAAVSAGRAYFITNGEPLPVRDLVNGIVTAAGLPPVERSIPAGAAVAVGALLEAFHRVARPEVEPMMTRFLARHLSTAHWYDISAARRDLGYQPEVSLVEGFERLRTWFEETGGHP
jgi:nucleoside-diphosphate-sugar epimerase